jgi:hypothetical protein
MRDGAYFDLHSPLGLLDDRDMLFFGGIHRVFDEQLHGLAAADKFPLSAMNDFNNVPAHFTFVNL